MSSISTSRRSAGLKGNGTNARQGRVRRNSGEISTRTVTCAICEAGYAPSPTRRDLLQASQEVLEAAFMSMCHYCFRCRRPACPQCWDAVHKVCGACVREVQLPSRAESSPLQGMVFPPPASQVGHVEATDTGLGLDAPIDPLLICVRAGRLQGSQAPRSQGSPAPHPRVPVKGTPTMDEGGSMSTLVHGRGTLHGYPGRGGRGNGDENGDGVGDKDKDENILVGDNVPLRTWAEFFGKVERVVNVVLGAILLFVVVLVVLAAFSATANARIIGLLHVDIRSEIAYIFYVIRQLHW